MLEFSNNEEFKKKQEEINKALKIASKKTDSKLLDEVVKEQTLEADPDIQKKCSMAHMLFDEMLCQFEEGYMSFKDAVDDLYKALKQI